MYNKKSSSAKVFAEDDFYYIPVLLNLSNVVLIDSVFDNIVSSDRNLSGKTLLHSAAYLFCRQVLAEQIHEFGECCLYC